MHSHTVFGQNSFQISTNSVQAFLTESGGQLAPVVFYLADRRIEPFSVAPWWNEHLDLPPILGVLRGDFFCLPFGGNDEPYLGEQHPIHGETANVKWALTTSSPTEITMEMTTTIRKGRVQKKVWVVPNQTAVYQRHTITEMEGSMSLGHHAMLHFQSLGCVSVSPFGFGQVFPGQFENPVEGGYSSLKPGARFSSLTEVPLATGGLADLSKYPAREGFEDLVMVYSKAGSDFAWTAVHFEEEGHVWFSLKDPRVLSGTVLWHSNGGRHYAPWSGRHRARLGLEEVTSSFHWGLAGSVRSSEASEAGYQTFLTLQPEKPLVINTIMGVAEAKGLMGPIARIVKLSDGIQIFDANHQSIHVQLHVDELYV